MLNKVQNFSFLLKSISLTKCSKIVKSAVSVSVIHYLLAYIHETSSAKICRCNLSYDSFCICLKLLHGLWPAKKRRRGQGCYKKASTTRNELDLSQQRHCTATKKFAMEMNLWHFIMLSGKNADIRNSILAICQLSRPLG